jgi:hypothetical protein
MFIRRREIISEFQEELFQAVNDCVFKGILGVLTLEAKELQDHLGLLFLPQQSVGFLEWIAGLFCSQRPCSGRVLCAHSATMAGEIAEAVFPDGF